MRSWLVVLVSALAVAGCAHRPGAGVPAKSYPVTGEVMMDGRLRVLSSVMTIRGTQFQIDNAFRVRQDGTYLAVCMSYVYRGPAELWEQARQDYAGSVALSITPPEWQKTRPITVALDPAPGYRLIPGVRMGVQELKTMRMACVTTDLWWSPAYEGKEAAFAIVPRGI